MDSLLQVGTLDDEAFQEFVLELRKKRAEELAEQERLREERQAEEAFRTVNNARDSRNPQGSTAAAQAGEAGFLYHRDPVRMQQGQVDFVQRWGERPLVPGWRRADAISASRSSARGEEGVSGTDAVQPGLNTPEGGLGLPVVDVSDVPRDPQSRTEMRNARAVARYELANVLFLSMNRPDSAATWYRMVIDEDSSRAVAQRAYYALAEVQQALGDSRAAQRLYRAIIDRFPSSDFAARAREQLGLSSQRTVESDTLALARKAYGQAYAAWQNGAYATALDSMITVAMHYPETPVAPRALLAAGIVYQEWAHRDSLDLEAPLPLSVPDSLLLDAGLLTIPEPEAPSPPPDTTVSADDASDPEAHLAADSAAVGEESSKVYDVGAPPQAGGTVNAAAVAADSAAGADSAAAGPDKVLPDAPAVRATPDSAAAPPSAVEEVDEDEGVPAAVDAADVAVGDTTVVADTTTVPPEPDPLTLLTLYERLVALYPQAPQADRARLVIDALEERQQARAEAEQAAADSLAQAASQASPPSASEPQAALQDSTQAVPQDSTRAALQDSTRAAPQDSTRAAAPDTTTAPQAPTEDEALPGTVAEEVDDEAVAYQEEPPAPHRPRAGAGPGDLEGRWVLVTATAAQRDQAEDAATHLRSQLEGHGDVSVRIVEVLEEGSRVFKVSLGSYATPEEAQAVREALGDVVPTAEPYRVPPRP